MQPLKLLPVDFSALLPQRKAIFLHQLNKDRFSDKLPMQVQQVVHFSLNQLSLHRRQLLRRVFLAHRKPLHPSVPPVFLDPLNNLHNSPQQDPFLVVKVPSEVNRALETSLAAVPRSIQRHLLALRVYLVDQVQTLSAQAVSVALDSLVLVQLQLHLQPSINRLSEGIQLLVVKRHLEVQKPAAFSVKLSRRGNRIIFLNNSDRSKVEICSET